MLGVVQDVDERKRVELALTESERSLAQLVADVPDDADALLRTAWMLRDCDAVSFASTPVKPRPKAPADGTPPPPAPGAGGSVNEVLPSTALKFTQGTPKRYAGKADSGRTLFRFFCGDCGSPLSAVA